MRRSIGALVVAAALLAACADDDGTVARNTTSTSSSTTKAPETMRFLALGDSYTIGESVDPAERWPLVLASRLEDEGSVASVDVEMVARTGWTTHELEAGIDDADPDGPFDLVSLLIGVNNQFRELPLDDYRTEFAVLLERAIGLAGGDPTVVVVVSIPDWSITPTGETFDPGDVAADEIDSFNAVAEEVTARLGARWVDITPISRSPRDGLVAPDGLHPSAEQYQAWVEEILPVAREVLAAG